MHQFAYVRYDGPIENFSIVTTKTEVVGDPTTIEENLVDDEEIGVVVSNLDSITKELFFRNSSPQSTLIPNYKVINQMEHNSTSGEYEGVVLEKRMVYGESNTTKKKCGL